MSLQINHEFISNVSEKPDNMFYRCRNCNTDLTSNSPATQYQIQKLIQKTVRVPQSLFTMNLGALSTYQPPLTQYQYVDINGAVYPVAPGVNWNQMSDRREPHIQKVVTSSGSAYGGNSTKRTIVHNRPGAMSPGGTGVDIKHNSYDRYLNRLKGKKPLKRGLISPTFGLPIPFNNSAPVYGNKQMKLGIVNGCSCSVANQDKLYIDRQQFDILNVQFQFQVGDYVWALRFSDNNFYKATIIAINVDGTYNVRFVSDNLVENGLTRNQIKIYFDCYCGENTSGSKPLDQYYVDGLLQACNTAGQIITFTGF